MRARHLIFFTALFVAASCYNEGRLNGYEEHDDGEYLRKGQPADYGAPWPLPQHYKTSKNFKILDTSDFEFSVGEFTCDILDQAFSRYYKIIFDQRPKYLRFLPAAAPKLSSLNVILQNPCEYLPTLESNESYSLVIDDNSSTLKAKSVWGILRGLETFSQIVHKIDGRLAVNYTWIEDFPRFAWRGVLLDSSRHFLPVQTILHSLDAMSYNKINVFHWHIVDDQSFPYESVKFPKLSLKGSYHPYTHIYTQAEVARVIEYARVRGIRVVVEFDTPGHMRSWENGQPGLLTECYTGSKPSGTYGPIDPSKNSTYEFIRDFFTEVSEVFPDSYVHLGGDEVGFNCWRSNPLINDFMRKMKIEGDYAKLESHYIEKLLAIIGKLKKNYIVWQEVFDHKLKVDSSTVVHVWKGNHALEMEKVTSAGLKTILSSPWYLDKIDYFKFNWNTYYEVDPQDFNGSPHQKALVMGGEACLWGEFVDSTNVHSRLWPSASAVAERLWSSQSVRDKNSALVRLEEHRCRMLKRGILAGPVSGPGFCETEVAL